MGIFMSEVLAAKLKRYRINETELALIEKTLGRPMKDIEWALFSALWSEHCSYKSSKVHLKKFAATLNSDVKTGSGENAGVVDLGQSEQVVFKMESHNHPSFIEPYQGAATGVGGILRDIFTMGARPIASANYLCFGEPLAPRMKSLVDGVVRGIAGYGNSVGVPTVTGQTQFDASYNQNILVNAMSVGLLLDGEPLALSTPKVPGELVVYVGAQTGKDGVHGAAMASESFDENSEAKKPNVQIGDPFFEKLLIESCLEVIKKGLVQAIQDMGAAGLTSSSFEMSSKAGLGFDLHLDKVPLRDPTMTPEEILLSESQERMLLVCKPQDLRAIQAVFERWGLSAVEIGVVRSQKEMILRWKGQILSEIDPNDIVDRAPMYQRKFEAWNFPKKTARQNQVSKTLKTEFDSRLGSPVWSNRDHIYRQYDQRVGGKTVQGAENDIALLRLPISTRGLMVAVGCRSSWMKRDAWIGAADAVLYPALQMAIKGGKAVAVTDCLNFGNPEKSEIMSEFVASVEAITEISVQLKTPVVSGNVSFYNETLGQGITSTPAVGLVGLRENIDAVPKDHFGQIGSHLVGFKLDFVKAEAEKWSGEPRRKDWREKIDVLRSLAQREEIISSQMSGAGGLAWTMCKMSTPKIGFVWTSETMEPLIDQLYQGVFEVSPEASKEICKEMNALGFEASVIGQTQKEIIEVLDFKRTAQEFIQAGDISWRKTFEIME
jgi:phosphoribosylformylglycinamidine synthase II